MKVQTQPNCGCMCFTAYDLRKLIVIHSLAVLTDADIFMERPDPMLFPGVDSSVELHSGFANEHASTASIILKEVKSLISQHNVKSVTLVSIEHLVTTLI
jgi:hypothetical protein